MSCALVSFCFLTHERVCGQGEIFSFVAAAATA